MNRYTTHCTPSQTRKALELGAPIEFEQTIVHDWRTGKPVTYPDIATDKDGEPILVTHTAEQMISWLEEQGMQFNVHSNMFNEWEVLVYTENTDNAICEIADSDWKKTKKEATIAAIDAALEYLSNNKN